MGEIFEAVDPRAFARYPRSYPGFSPFCISIIFTTTVTYR